MSLLLIFQFLVQCKDGYILKTIHTILILYVCVCVLEIHTRLFVFQVNQHRHLPINTMFVSPFFLLSTHLLFDVLSLHPHT